MYIEQSTAFDAEWINVARERFGDNFDLLLAMRQGGNPFRHGRGGFPHRGIFGKEGFERGDRFGFDRERANLNEKETVNQN
ncbi:hypothetical protein AGMMS49975_13970 [Clostridia bacterium]|nr:hypothetical protein AGMMS49975_13970 [Clostridia bacterium]